MNSKTKAILSLASALVLGFACCFFLFYFGILEHRHAYRPGKSHSPDIVNQFTKELGLNDAQIAVLKQELDRVQKGHEQIRKVSEVEFRGLREEFRQSFAKTLTAEQQVKFTEFNRRRDEQRRR